MKKPGEEETTETEQLEKQTEEVKSDEADVDNGEQDDYGAGYSLNKLRLDAMTRFNELQDAGSMTDLEQCLAKFTSVESLTDKIICEKCSSRQRGKAYRTATKQYLLCEMPAVLTVHLKRFQHHGAHLAKSNKFVSFPFELDMSPYASRMCVGDARTLYRLYGLVEHSGRLNSGHYTACVKVADDEQDQVRANRRLFLSPRRICNLNKIITNSSDFNHNSEKSKVFYRTKFYIKKMAKSLFDFYSF